MLDTFLRISSPEEFMQWHLTVWTPDNNGSYLADIVAPADWYKDFVVARINDWIESNFDWLSQYFTDVALDETFTTYGMSRDIDLHIAGYFWYVEIEYPELHKRLKQWQSI